MKEIQSEARLTFWEATSIIVGHGVGSGILAVPYLASRNSWRDIIWVLIVVYAINLLMHFMIAELSLNNGGAQFVKCFELELFTGKLRKPATWLAFILLGVSCLMNVSGFITGAAAVFTTWFGWPDLLAKIVYYVLAALVVFFGMKLVGICEKIAVFAMVAVIGILFVATLIGDRQGMPNHFVAAKNILALYGMVAFSLSAVMSAPQVVKGLNGDPKKIRAAITTGTGINLGLILIITVMTLIGAGSHITENGALVDLAKALGGWVSIIGYIFSLLALSTSFWANTLNLRDIIHEQMNWNNRLCWLIASLPCLILALVGAQSFVGFVRLASVIQVVTGIGIIISYYRSRKKNPEALICGKFGKLPFQILVVLSGIVASVGAVVSVA